ncbi:MAG: nucleotidyltransferase domain-containing protein [Bacillota bacterium]
MARRRKRRNVLPWEAVIGKLKSAADRLKKIIPVDCVYLYGSYARGHPKPYSDVDVAVVSPAFGRDIVAEAVMLMEVFEGEGLIVEPRAYSREEYDAAGPGTFLYEEVIKKGVRIL